MTEPSTAPGPRKSAKPATLILIVVLLATVSAAGAFQRYSLVVVPAALGSDLYSVLVHDNWTDGGNVIPIIGEYSKWEGLRLGEVVTLKLGAWVGRPLVLYRETRGSRKAESGSAESQGGDEAKSGSTETRGGAEAKSNWHTRSNRSKIDDSTNVYLSLDASDTIETRLERTRPSLHIRCTEDKTEAYINVGATVQTDTYAGGVSSARVTTRIGKLKASSIEMSLSTSRKAAFFPRPIGFVKQLFEHGELIVQITPWASGRVTISFPITGIEAAVKPLRTACHW